MSAGTKTFRFEHRDIDRGTEVHMTVRGHGNITREEGYCLSGKCFSTNSIRASFSSSGIVRAICVSCATAPGICVFFTNTITCCPSGWLLMNMCVT